jgi:hypothetical protein
LFEELRDEAYRDCVKNKETVKLQQIVPKSPLDETERQKVGGIDNNETF